jgi:hypothetical protein
MPGGTGQPVRTTPVLQSDWPIELDAVGSVQATQDRNRPRAPAVTVRQGRMTRFQRGRSEPGHAPAQNENEADRS